MDTASGTAATTGGAASSTLRGQDAEFLRQAMQSGQEEVQNAQLALQSAQRSETRNAASMMVQDHQRANQQLEQLAQRKGWAMPASSMSSGSAQSDQARSSSSSMSSSGSGDFDSRFVSEEIRHHRDSISLFRSEASGGSDPDLRQFAKDNLPKLEHHLAMLESANARK